MGFAATILPLARNNPWNDETGYRYWSGDKSDWTGPASTSVPTPSADAGTGSLAGAGIGAAGTTAATIAQIAASKFAMDTANQQNSLDRATSEKMARMQLDAQRSIFAGKKKDAMQNMVLAALQSNIGTILQNRDTQRAANNGFDTILSRAFLRR